MKPNSNDILYRVLKNGFLFPVATVSEDGQIDRAVRSDDYELRLGAYEAALTDAFCDQGPRFTDESFFFRLNGLPNPSAEILVRDAVSWNAEPSLKAPEACFWPEETPASIIVEQTLSAERWGEDLPTFDDISHDLSQAVRGAVISAHADDPDGDEIGTLADGYRGWKREDDH